MGVCQKFWGLIKQHHLPTCTSLRNRRTVWTYSTSYIKCEIAKIHTHLFASQNALVLISNGEAGQREFKFLE